MLSPTPGGLAGRLGLPQPATAEDKILTIAQAATQLLDELAEISGPQRGKLAAIAEMMRAAAGDGHPIFYCGWGLALQRMAPRMAGQQRYGQTLQKFRKADFARRPV